MHPVTETDSYYLLNVHVCEESVTPVELRWTRHEWGQRWPTPTWPSTRSSRPGAPSVSGAHTKVCVSTHDWQGLGHKHPSGLPTGAPGLRSHTVPGLPGARLSLLTVARAGVHSWFLAVFFPSLSLSPLPQGLHLGAHWGGSSLPRPPPSHTPVPGQPRGTGAQKPWRQEGVLEPEGRGQDPGGRAFCPCFMQPWCQQQGKTRSQRRGLGRRTAGPRHQPLRGLASSDHKLQVSCPERRAGRRDALGCDVTSANLG